MKKHAKTYHQGGSRLRQSIATVLLAALPLAALFSSCANEEYPAAATTTPATETYLNLNVQTAAPTTTRAAGTETTTRVDDSETTPANPSTESSIHSICVWAFSSSDAGSDALPISFKEESLASPIDGENSTKTISMKIPRMGDGTTIDYLDLYILANAESITGLLDGVTYKKTLTRGQLESLSIADQFGIASDGKPQTTTVPDKGLPVSRVIKNINVNTHIAETPTAAAAKALNIPLVRAVSKLHFFFARKSNAATENVKITKIELDPEVLPTASKVFPIATTVSNMETDGLTGLFTADTQYTNTKMVMDGIDTDYIHEVEDPTTLIRQSGETASEYMERLYAATKESNRCYLRESNKPLTGTIYYQLSTGAKVKTAAFQIPSTTDTPAYRNHELVVYGYFQSSGTAELTLKYYVAEWADKAATNINFN